MAMFCCPPFRHVFVGLKLSEARAVSGEAEPRFTNKPDPSVQDSDRQASSYCYFCYGKEFQGDADYDYQFVFSMAHTSEALYQWLLHIHYICMRFPKRILRLGLSAFRHTSLHPSAAMLKQHAPGNLEESEAKAGCGFS